MTAKCPRVESVTARGIKRQNAVTLYVLTVTGSATLLVCAWLMYCCNSKSGQHLACSCPSSWHRQTPRHSAQSESTDDESACEDEQGDGEGPTAANASVYDPLFLLVVKTRGLEKTSPLSLLMRLISRCLRIPLPVLPYWFLIPESCGERSGIYSDWRIGELSAEYLWLNLARIFAGFSASCC